MRNYNKIKGFTLIELIVVIGIIAILAAIVIIAINPARQFAQARNTQRNSDVNQILNAVYQYSADNNGALPPSIATLTTETPVCNTGTAEASSVTPACVSGTVDLRVLVPTYISAMPKDPKSAGVAGATSDYYIVVGDTTNGVPTGRVRVRANGTELDAATEVTTDDIQVTR